MDQHVHNNRLYMYIIVWKWILSCATQASRQSNQKEKIFQQVVLEQLDSEPTQPQSTQINSRWITDLNMKAKTANSSRRNIFQSSPKNISLENTLMTLEQAIISQREHKSSKHKHTYTHTSSKFKIFLNKRHF